MKIIITGAGDVGYHLAKMLSSELQDIYLIDLDESRLNYIQSHIDIFPIKGDATSPKVLEEAKISSCDLLIAVTSSEKTNLLVSIIAKRYGAKQTIARISNMENLNPEIQEMYTSLGLDTMISPVQLASDEIVRLLSKTAFTDNYAFDDGLLSVFGLPIGDKSPLKEKTVEGSAYLNPNLSFSPIAIHRNEDTIMVKKDTVILENDILYFVSTPETIDDLTALCDQACFEIKNIMIMGGSRIGVRTAKLLQNNYKVVLLERNRDRCKAIAAELTSTLVLNIDGSDVEAIKEEGLNEMDAFIAATGDSERNIISCLVAKNNGVRKTISRVENIDYIHLSQNIGIDTLINKKIIAASEIFKYVRKGDVDAIVSLHGVDAEIIEFNVKANSKVTKRKIKKLNFPDNARIAGVVRDGKGFIPFGDFQMEANDKAIVFSLTDSIHKIERFFL